MTYLVQRRRRRQPPYLTSKPVRRARALGGVQDVPILGWIIDPAEKLLQIGQNDAMACIAQADQATADLDAKWQNMAASWHPTGYYTPADIDTLVSQTLSILQQAKISVIMAPLSTSDAATVKAQAIDSIDKRNADAAKYSQAASAARAGSVKTVQADGLKDWVLGSMVDASAGFATTAMLQCERTWLDTASDALDRAWAVMQKIVGVVLEAGEVALKTVGDTVDLLAWLQKYGVFVALGGAALWYYSKKSKRAVHAP